MSEAWEYILVCPACEAAARHWYVDEGDEYVGVVRGPLAPRCEWRGHPQKPPSGAKGEG